MVDIAKAGWLLRETSFLKRWKLTWFSLSIDGYLRQFDSPDSLIAKKTILVPKDVTVIKIGADAQLKPPEGRKMEALIKIITRNSTWNLCAESVDDMLAWQLALEQSRVVNRVQMMNQNLSQIPPHLVEALNYNPNNGYPMYYRGNYSGQYPSRIVHTSQGPITVVYVDDPYYYRRGYRGDNLAYGALAGTLLASTLFWPFWIPFFWC